jgi:hypothetical protein
MQDPIADGLQWVSHLLDPAHTWGVVKKSANGFMLDNGGFWEEDSNS